MGFKDFVCMDGPMGRRERILQLSLSYLHTDFPTSFVHVDRGTYLRPIGPFEA